MISNTMRNVVPYQHEPIGKLVKPNSVDLCIASLQALTFDLTSDRKKSLRKFSQLVQKILKQIFTTTKTGGVCCIVVGNDYDFEKDALVPIMTAVLKALEPSKGSGWIYKDEIIWVKSSKGGAEKMNNLKNVEMVSFDQIPFSHILVLAKDPVFEFKERSDKRREEDRVENWLTHFGMNKYQCHCSGHAQGRDLLETVSEISPKNLYPVHTEHPDAYTKATDKITIVQEGTKYDL